MQGNSRSHKDLNTTEDNRGLTELFHTRAAHAAWEFEVFVFEISFYF
jgi:hypothetical protein